MSLLSSNTANQIVKEIYELINLNVNIINNKGIIIASTNSKRIGQFHEGAFNIIKEGLKELIVEDNNIYEGTLKGINLPIRIDDEIIGVIGITGDHEQVKEYGKIIKKMTEILVVESYQRKEKNIKEKIVSRYIEEWLSGKFSNNYTDLVRRGKTLNIDITIPRRVVLFNIVQASKIVDTREEQKLIDRAERDIIKEIERDNSDNIFCKCNSNIVALIANRSNTAILSFSKNIANTIERKYSIRVNIGIDKAVEDTSLIVEAYVYAQKALQVAIKSNSNKIKLYDDLNLEIILHEIPIQYKHEFIKKVFLNVDNSIRQEWIKILKMFFDSNGSVSYTAEALFMHKNTLQYKLNKISETTGYNPRKLNDIPILKMAIFFFEELN